MDYEKMWNELKNKIQEDYQYYKDGSQCSLIESINGEIFCGNFLKKMTKIENQNR